MWLAARCTGGTSTKIYRANLDGSNVEDLVTTRSKKYAGPTDIALDVGKGKMYWTEGKTSAGYTAKIRRANLDGSNVEDPRHHKIRHAH